MLWDSLARLSAAASVAPGSPNAADRKPADASSVSNSQKQWTTRTRKPPFRNGPNRWLHAPYSNRSGGYRRETECRPEAKDDIGRGVLRLQAKRGALRLHRKSRAGRGQARDDRPLGGIDDQDVAIRHRPECADRGHQLARR